MSLLILSNTNALAEQEGLLQKIIHHKILEAKTGNQIYIFVSFAMPDSALKSYYVEAEQEGARLIMRDLKNNSFLDTKAKADEINISFDIDTAEKVKTLEQLSATVNNKRMKIQNQFNNTPESTIVRTAEEVADNLGISDKAIQKRNIKLRNYKNKKQ
ncbi:TrbC family F-type conjugative pilus assembly protein [Rickettsia hoogstraalii]|nr:TrbC family F-type conjugative pilus assembly protein [Rickettsia hoogstraalii]